MTKYHNVPGEGTKMCNATDPSDCPYENFDSEKEARTAYAAQFDSVVRPIRKKWVNVIKSDETQEPEQHNPEDHMEASGSGTVYYDQEGHTAAEGAIFSELQRVEQRLKEYREELARGVKPQRLIGTGYYTSDDYIPGVSSSVIASHLRNEDYDKVLEHYAKGVFEHESKSRPGDFRTRDMSYYVSKNKEKMKSYNML